MRESDCRTAQEQSGSHFFTLNARDFVRIQQLWSNSSMKSQFSRPENQSKTTLISNQTAVVIGGSMAGLLAARVLSQHFDQVVVIERDQYPTRPEPRPNTPQANHVHVLLARGLQSFEGFFPGLRKEMLAEGALEIETSADIAWLNPAGWGVRFDSGVRALSFSRGLLDWVVRRRLAAFNNIHFLDNRLVTELIADEAGKRLIGVTFRHRQNDGENDSGEEWLAADLIIDSAGRASKTPQWLAALGYQRPTETIVNAHLGYSSRLYRIPQDFNADWKATFVQSAPPEHIRGGILFPIEGNRWLVTMVGGEKDYPPTDEEGFLSFARSLRNSIIYDAIKNAEPLSPIFAHRGTENRRRHYEQLKRMPEGLIVIGDGACAFNPVYGQGMTTAALGAEWLNECLRKQFANGQHEITGLGRKFQRGLARLNASPWMLSTGEDYRYRKAEGGSPNLFNRFMHWFIDQILQLTTYDISVRQSFLSVQGMLKSPTTLFAPKIFLRVLRNARRNLFSRAEKKKTAKVETPSLAFRDKASPSRF